MPPNEIRHDQSVDLPELSPDLRPQAEPANNEALPPMSNPETATGGEGDTEQSKRAELPQTSMPPDPAPLPAPVVPGGNPLQMGTPDPTLSATTASSNDTDLVEKEWVDKAKAILAHFKDDPHAQTREIQQFKAEYMKKRYNKDLPVSEQ